MFKIKKNVILKFENYYNKALKMNDSFEYNIIIDNFCNLLFKSVVENSINNTKKDINNFIESLQNNSIYLGEYTESMQDKKKTLMELENNKNNIINDFILKYNKKNINIENKKELKKILKELYNNVIL